MWIHDILAQHGRIFALSPMADMTDSAFCQIVRDVGGADIVFREMVSAEAIVRENKKTLGMTDFVEKERPIVQQIFGADPRTMAEAAAIVMEHASPEGIDINMGCPVYKITSNFNGAALMKEPERAAAILREMRHAVGAEVPISVKIRLGWESPDDFKTFIPVIEEAGANLITIHGRTKCQGYSGKSDWERIRQAKAIATVPLLANGDIHRPEQVDSVLDQTKADGVLIARGALGNPWFFQSIGRESAPISFQERVRVVVAHARLHAEHHRRMRALSRAGCSAELVTFRKHLAWYFKNDRMGFEMPRLKELRVALMQISTVEELEHAVENFVP